VKRNFWTPPRVLTLTTYLSTGYTYSEAAVHFGTTKSAVAGVIRRHVYQILDLRPPRKRKIKCPNSF
jgi:predicted DNA-binding protein YlxM (UPF0122 family)